MDFTRPPRCLKLPKCHKLHTRPRWSTMGPQATYSFFLFSHFFSFFTLLVAPSSSLLFPPCRSFFQVALSSLLPLPPSCSFLLGTPSSLSLFPMFHFIQERHFIKFEESVTYGRTDGWADGQTDHQTARRTDGRTE